MRIKIVHDKNDLLGFRVHLINHIFDFFSLVNCSSVFSDACVMTTSKRLYEGKDTACTFTNIF